MDLKTQWHQRFKSKPPQSAQTLKMVLDWYEKAELSKERMNIVIAKLEELAKQKPNKSLATGTKIIKTWHGKKYEIIVTNEGFLYENKIYQSLTALAKIISGTHQSGNLFFKVKNVK